MAIQIRRLSALALCAVFLSSCGKGPSAPRGNAGIPTLISPAPGEGNPLRPFDAEPPPEAKPGAPADPTDPGIAYFHHASLWASPVSSSQPWTRAVVNVVHSRLHDFERARDVEEFCPGYFDAPLAQREVCWLRLVGGVVEFESSFRPDEPPFYEGHGVYSVGLLALSTGECANAPTQKDLQDPVQNLLCGVNKMAALIVRAGAIDSPKDDGAAAYWSTLRPPHKVWDPIRNRWLNLGKKNQIIERTKIFRRFH